MTLENKCFLRDVIVPEVIFEGQMTLSPEEGSLLSQETCYMEVMYIADPFLYIRDD